MLHLLASWIRLTNFCSITFFSVFRTSLTFALFIFPLLQTTHMAAT